MSPVENSEKQLLLDKVQYGANKFQPDGDKGPGQVELQDIKEAPQPSKQQSEDEPHAGTSAESAALGATTTAGEPSSTEVPSCSSRESSYSEPSCSAKEPLLCRICFEEDVAANLEQPCGCTGTQSNAHHACIQRWVTEKGNIRCEVCEQDYKGAFIVPPPAPPATITTEAIIHPVFGPMIIRVEDGSARTASVELYDDAEQYDQRHPGTSWCLTFIIFVMFLVVLHHTTQVADGMDGTDTSGMLDDTGMVDPGGMSGGMGPMSSGGATDAMGNPVDDPLSAGMTLILFWFIAKILLFGIPLYTVMRIAARQAQREQYEAMFGAGAQVAEVGPHGRMVFRVVRTDAHEMRNMREGPPRGPFMV